MKFRNTITALCLFGSLMCGAQSTGNSAQSLFPYPQAPDELTTLQERASYLVSHFWDRCNMQSAILNRDAFKGAFMDYISFLPYAQADTVHNSISRLIAAYEKAPDKLLTLAELAEDAVYNGNADYISDEIFLPFANAVVNNKKISKTNKARIAHEAKVLTQTQVGQVAPELKYTLSDGTTSTLSSTRGAHVLLFVNDPDCDECRMTRIRLSADHNINQLLDEGLLRIVSIYPDDYSADWAQSVANYNSRWIVAATPDVEDEYDLRSTPALYYLNPEGVILSKTLDPDSLLEAFHVVNSKMTH
ncbi:MAG: DUF5106 domain-containing protein [Barnesiella sp.]|nr:DUF5106 domain-containing protein [Bacteroidales bacterium]MBD5247201.1 DUF5106 domain-containing protein [Barnesiella sp.]MBD5258343.1 DUF5106 domain-containing protein [Barnesiella sp.]